MPAIEQLETGFSMTILAILHSIRRVVVIDSAILRRTLVEMYKANDNPTTSEKVPVVAIAAIVG